MKSQKYNSPQWNNQPSRHNKLFIAFLSLASFLVSTSSVEAGPRGHWYRDKELSISFHYPSKFIPAEPAELTTRHVVNWRSKKSQGLIASCYLRATLIKSEAHEGRTALVSNRALIVAAFVKKTNLRATSVKVIEARPIKSDGLQSLFLKVDSTIENFDQIYNLRTYTILTFWKGHEVALECGSTVPVSAEEQLPEEEAQATVRYVEDGIWSVLRTLHFQRH